MCGIAGIFAPSSFQKTNVASEKTLSNMLDLIAHRGPDGRGEEIGEYYALGHVRLSILDTSEQGRQPMWCSEKRYCLVYNGELYNFKTLRSDLSAKGYNFKSNSDSEVVLYALIEWRAKALDKFEGMFAGALLDTQEKTLFAFRDQLGIKPFYYTWKNNMFCFASEVKALKPVTGRFFLNNETLYEQFHYRFVSGERTLYQNIKRLEPGCHMFLKENGSNKPQRYYSVLNGLKDDTAEKYDFEKIEHGLEQSIKEHTVSDVGYSIQLSGGIDSSYITTVLSREKQNIDTYSMTLPGFDTDETPYQDVVVEKCGTSHHSYPCTLEDFAEYLPAVIYHLDYPMVHTGTVFLYLLCKRISKENKVVLTGEGADELFLGYSRYNIPLSHKYAFFLHQKGLRSQFFPNLSKIRGLKSLLDKDWGLDAGSFDSIVWENILSISANNPRVKTVEEYKTLLGKMMASDQTAYLGSLLERQDKISMAHGVEVRVPFCNHKLFDSINKINHATKVKGTPKTLLKTILAKDYSHEFVYRPKNGFKLPIAQWIRDEKSLGRYLSYLSDDTFKSRPFFKYDVVQNVVNDHLSNKVDYAKEIFSLITFEIWMRQIQDIS